MAFEIKNKKRIEGENMSLHRRLAKSRDTINSQQKISQGYRERVDKLEQELKEETVRCMNLEKENKQLRIRVRNCLIVFIVHRPSKIYLASPSLVFASPVAPPQGIIYYGIPNSLYFVIA